MTEQEFNQLAREGYNRIPLTRELPADLDTPLSVYLKLADAPYSYLLESVVGGERFGRYSFIGLPAHTVLRVYGHLVSVETDAVKVEQEEVGDPLAFVEQFLGRFRAAVLPGLPRFAGGLAGYFGYDTVRYIEKRLKATHQPDVLHAPDILLLLTDELAVVDNLTGKLTLIVYADPMQADAYAEGYRRLNALSAQIRAPYSAPTPQKVSAAAVESEFGEAAFKQAVLRAKQYIVEGDIMQVVLSQRMSRPFDASPLTLYRALRSLNPSPYMFYYDMGSFHVVGASPEILVRLEEDTVTVRPIAGTRPRGANREHDTRLAAELLADPKECAEHLQLLDLGRNDAGRVAVTGSIQVTENMLIERYSHVMHIVSNVEGKLKPGLSAMDVLRATFPAGTVSGAPKVRAMEIIDELEPSKRGVYAGAVGYLGFGGGMDLAIAIRTAVVKDGTLYVQAGAGIVADSVPENEWTETQNKARAVIRAAELAQAGLDGVEE
ncbi:anthranilate synthase component I [Sulfuriferula plumbiphila]|uniref:Anthranilate synthase component 1 n=1 Tax=Sulfuriferula plumbiphila TaxID=171865 RepID=A0A512LAA3_9PROT|nr:anthranilate synthase component I [Sulfuriferula plumbiphila]BBP03115.1 anthranilate synthase component I [Sulfuriferula plumbiphila]GEP31415.1 anthranilate synthase component I [Sulfuriferula plumbiphila]